MKKNERKKNIQSYLFTEIYVLKALAFIDGDYKYIGDWILMYVFSKLHNYIV